MSAIFCAVVGAAAKVGDVSHVHTIGDDEFDDRLAEQVAGHQDRNGSHPGDLAQFLAVDPAAAQRCRVDAQ